MKTRKVIGVGVGIGFYAMAMGSIFLHRDECSPYAAVLGLNPGPVTEDNPYGLTACDDFGLLESSDALSILLVCFMCVVGSLLAARICGSASFPILVGTGLAGVVFTAVGGFAYSGLSLALLLQDPEFYSALVVAALINVIVVVLERRRSPHGS